MLSGRAAAQDIAVASKEYAVSEDPSKVFGRGADVDGGYGLRVWAAFVVKPVFLIRCVAMTR